MIKLKDLIICLNDNAWIEVVAKCVSYGAYSVEELLEENHNIEMFKNNADLLNMNVPKNGIEIYTGIADEVVAESSKTRNGFFQKKVEISYMVVEVK